MAKNITYSTICLLICAIMSGCYSSKDSSELVFATSAEYPPFEYMENGELKGFDIELGQMIAKEMGKKAIFVDMAFSSILPSLNTPSIDAAIATITATKLRSKNFDFSEPYYWESISVISLKEAQLPSKGSLVNKKIAAQLGSTMEIWLKTNIENANMLTMDTNTQAIEALKAGHADGVLVDTAQAHAFCNQNPNLTYSIIAMTDLGYSIAFPKGSPLVDPINKIIASLKEKGELEKLEKKYLGEPL